MPEDSSTPKTDLTRAPTLKAARDKNSFTALGRAVSYMMTKPSFAGLNFGHWTKTLTGQINRNHYFFVLEENRIVGFLGWAFVDEALAKKWAEGLVDVAGEVSKNGDCIIINAWAADTAYVNKFILRQIRVIMKDCKAAYAKRFYKDGRIRPLRVTLSDLVDNHIEIDKLL